VKSKPLKATKHLFFASEISSHQRAANSPLALVSAAAAVARAANPVAVAKEDGAKAVAAVSAAAQTTPQLLLSLQLQ